MFTLLCVIFLCLRRRTERTNSAVRSDEARTLLSPASLPHPLPSPHLLSPLPVIFFPLLIFCGGQTRQALEAGWLSALEKEPMPFPPPSWNTGSRYRIRLICFLSLSLSLSAYVLSPFYSPVDLAKWLQSLRQLKNVPCSRVAKTLRTCKMGERTPRILYYTLPTVSYSGTTQVLHSSLCCPNHNNSTGEKRW